MDTRGILDQLLQTATSLANRGRDAAENALGIPEEGEQREATVSGLKKGAAVGGVLALLLGTGAGRRLAGPLLKYGGLAAIGGLAYKTYQDWQAKQGAAAPVSGPPVAELSGPEADKRSLLLVSAMISAAKADGHIDTVERQNITTRIRDMELDGDLSGLVQSELARPLDARYLAAEVDSPEAAAEVYLVSMLVIDADNESEKQYLDDLARELGLSHDYIQHIEAELAG